jgi:amino acid permease
LLALLDKLTVCLLSAMVIIVILYVGMGLFGYLSFGENALGEDLDL